MAQYQHPKDKNRVLEVGENEATKRRILEQSGWKLVPAGQEVAPAAKPATPKQGKQTQPTTASPQPLNVKAEAPELRGVDVQPKGDTGKGGTL
jgi:hypothetical protein